MNELVVSVIVILLPGIVAAVIADKVAVHSRWSSFKFGLYALVLGVASYVLLQCMLWIINCVMSIFDHDVIHLYNLSVWSVEQNGGGAVRAWEVVLASLFSVPVALMASYFVNAKIITRFAQKIGVTGKYGDENLFSYYLNTKEVDWVYVRDSSAGLTYQGRVMSLSENERMQELVLVDVSVFRYTDSALLYSVPSIYLSRPPGAFAIEAIPIDNMEKVDE